MTVNPHDAEEAMRPATDLVRPHGVPLMIRPDFQALLDLLGQWWIDQQGHEPNLGDLAERIAAATEDYGTVREQGRQDGIIDGRRGYVEVTADQSRPVPRASEGGSIDRDALLREIDHAWSHAQRNDVLADRILALVRPVEGVTLRRCSWEDCPGLEKSIPMHEQEEGPELHEVCEAAMISPEAVAELTGLYQQLAQERKDRLAEGAALSPKEALLAAEALRFQAATTGHIRPTKAHVWRALASRLEARS